MKRLHAGEAKFGFVNAGPADQAHIFDKIDG
jgi:hypothetical protein